MCLTLRREIHAPQIPANLHQHPQGASPRQFELAAVPSNGGQAPEVTRVVAEPVGVAQIVECRLQEGEKRFAIGHGRRQENQGLNKSKARLPRSKVCSTPARRAGSCLKLELCSGETEAARGGLCPSTASAEGAAAEMGFVEPKPCAPCHVLLSKPTQAARRGSKQPSWERCCCRASTQREGLATEPAASRAQESPALPAAGEGLGNVLLVLLRRVLEPCSVCQPLGKVFAKAARD